MRAWDCAIVVLACGRCGAIIRKGEAYQVLTFSEKGRRLKRCTLCADGPAPADFAGLDKRDSRGPVMLKLGDVGLDWKHAQGNTREPGQEG